MKNKKRVTKSSPSTNHQENGEKKYSIPTGYQSQGGDLVGYWDPKEGPIHFIPLYVNLFDNSVEPIKSSALLFAKLVDATNVLARDEDDSFTATPAKPNDMVGIWLKPGMKALKNLANVKVFMYEDGELDTGKPNPMKLYKIFSNAKGELLRVEDDRREKSKNSSSVFSQKRQVQTESVEETDEETDESSEEDSEAPPF